MPGHHAIAFDDLLDCSLIEDLVTCYAKSHLDKPFTSFKAPPMQVEERFWFDWTCPEIAQQVRLSEESGDVSSLSTEGDDNLQQLIEVTLSSPSFMADIYCCAWSFCSVLLMSPHLGLTKCT